MKNQKGRGEVGLKYWMFLCYTPYKTNFAGH